MLVVAGDFDSVPAYFKNLDEFPFNSISLFEGLFCGFSGFSAATKSNTP